MLAGNMECRNGTPWGLAKVCEQPFVFQHSTAVQVSHGLHVHALLLAVTGIVVCHFLLLPCIHRQDIAAAASSQ
jgi:hypothetical protein